MPESPESSHVAELSSDSRGCQMTETQPLQATALAPSPLCDPCPALLGICEPSPSSVLLALLLPVPHLLSAAPPWGVGAFFFFPGGGRRGRREIKDSIPDMGGKVRFEKGQKQGRQSLCLHQGLLGVRPCTSSCLRIRQGRTSQGEPKKEDKRWNPRGPG